MKKYKYFFKTYKKYLKEKETMSKFRKIRRRLECLLKKPKFFKKRKELLKYQTFCAICFIGNSPNTMNHKQTVSQALVNCMNASVFCWKQFIEWIKKKSITISSATMPMWALSFAAICYLLLDRFNKKCDKETNNLKDFLKNLKLLNIILFLIIYWFLLMITDIPTIPVMKLLHYLYDIISNLITESAKSNPVLNSFSTSKEVGLTYSSKNKYFFIVGLIGLKIFIDFLTERFEQKLMESLPCGNILYKLYEWETGESKSNMIPIE